MEKHHRRVVIIGAIVLGDEDPHDMRLPIDDDLALEEAGAVGKFIGGVRHHRALASAEHQQCRKQQDRETKHNRTVPVWDLHLALIGKPLAETLKSWKLSVLDNPEQGSRAAG